MNTQKKFALFAVLSLVLLLFVVSSLAHNPGYTVPSPGKPPAFSISLDGVDGGAAEWPGAWEFDIGVGADPMKGHVRALHKADGIYLQVRITECMTCGTNNFDALVVIFDLGHNGGAGPNPDADDFGIQILRDPMSANAKKWGPATADPSAWTNIPDANAMLTTDAAGWTVEIRLPTGGPLPGCGTCVLDLNANGGNVGIYFQIFDAGIFGPAADVYTQWPDATMADGLDTLFYQIPPNASVPNKWGNYVFDPASTNPNVAATDVRRTGGLPNTLSFSADNTFEVRVNNPGGTAIADAGPCRLNLYLAARGIGDPWHRLDQPSTIDGDCNQPLAAWPSLVLAGAAKNQVCTGTGPGSTALQDISAVPIANLNSPGYTIKNGVTRLDGGAVTIPAATNNYYSVLTWNLSGTGQDVKFAGSRAHLCMMAEVLCPNDPNPSNNTRQANMDFESLGGGGGGGGAGGGEGFGFNLGNAGFAKYDPAVGKDMFLQVEMKNMNRQAGWDFKLEGVSPIAGDQFVARLKGKDPIEARLVLKAPAAEAMGRTLKENLMVPPKAGGFQANSPIPSGEAPVYVRVTGGTTLLIANYAFHPNDAQNVDLDGGGKLLPPNGPNGLPNPLLQSLIRKLGSKFKLLLAPNAPLGALVGSWDNFQTAFLIGDGVQVKVPAGAKFLALGINDAVGFYPDNRGTGFRVKIVERPAGITSAGTPSFLKASFSSQPPAQAQRDIVPIHDVMPTLCINGYENIGKKHSINGQSRELFRYIGNVCWGIVNVFPPNRSDKPDQGDAFDGPQPQPIRKGCGSSNRKSGFAFASFITLLGILVIQRRTSAKARSQR